MTIKNPLVEFANPSAASTNREILRLRAQGRLTDPNGVISGIYGHANLSVTSQLSMYTGHNLYPT
jgi:hypothetical protein